MRTNQQPTKSSWIHRYFALICVAVVISALCASPLWFCVVQHGFVGVKTRMGIPVAYDLAPGPHIMIPVIDSIQTIKIQNYQLTVKGLACTTKLGQRLLFPKIELRFDTEPQAIPELLNRGTSLDVRNIMQSELNLFCHDEDLAFLRSIRIFETALAESIENNYRAKKFGMRIRWLWTHIPLAFSSHRVRVPLYEFFTVHGVTQPDRNNAHSTPSDNNLHQLPLVSSGSNNQSLPDPSGQSKSLLKSIHAVTAAPTAAPTTVPTTVPTAAPSSKSTAMPSSKPTTTSSNTPTPAPTFVPTVAPAGKPLPPPLPPPPPPAKKSQMGSDRVITPPPPGPRGIDSSGRLQRSSSRNIEMQRESERMKRERLKVKDKDKGADKNKKTDSLDHSKSSSAISAPPSVPIAAPARPAVHMPDCLRYRNASFIQDESFAQSRVPPVLLSFRGAGDRYLRKLLEYSTGVLTGSVSPDPDPESSHFAAHGTCSILTSVILARPGELFMSDNKQHINFSSRKNRRNCYSNYVRNFEKIIFLARNPYELLLDNLQSSGEESSSSSSLSVSGHSSERRNSSTIDLKAAMMARESATFDSTWIKFVKPFQDELDTFFLPVRYESLLNTTTRQSALREVISFMGFSQNVTEQRMECAFWLMDQEGKQRGESGVEVILKEKEDKKCEIWQNVQRFAQSMGYAAPVETSCQRTSLSPPSS